MRCGPRDSARRSTLPGLPSSRPSIVVVFDYGAWQYPAQIEVKAVGCDRWWVDSFYGEPGKLDLVPLMWNETEPDIGVYDPMNAKEQS